MHSISLEEQEEVPEPPPGYEEWREYAHPGGRWTPRAAKAGAYLTTTVAGGLLFAYVLGMVPNVHTITFSGVSPSVGAVAALGVLAALGVSHEGLHGLVARVIGADASFRLTGGGLRTLSRHAIQTRGETLAFYLVPLVVASPIWFVILMTSGYLRAPVVLLVAYLVLSANVAGSAIDVYHAWEIWRLPEGTLIYNTTYRMMVTFPSSEPATLQRQPSREI